MATDLTDRQKLADFAEDYDLPKIHLRAHESVVNYGVRDGNAVVVIQRYRTEETRTQLRFVAQGTLVRSWSRSRVDEYGEPAWAENAPMMIWAADFAPFAVALYNGRTVAEHIEHERFSAECYRPGSDRAPMDNFDRTAAYPSATTPTMSKHWGLA